MLVDDAHRLRAAVTAFWLTQLNQAEVFILDGELTQGHGVFPSQPEPNDGRGCRPDEIAGLVDSGNALVVDLGPSLNYESGHLPGAFFLLA